MADFSELIDTINNKVLEAIDASNAGDFEGALLMMEQASMALAVVPNGKIEESEVAWDRESIERAIVNLRRRTARRAGVVTQEVRYQRG